MRKAQKKMALEFVQTLYQVHEQIRSMIDRKEMDHAMDLLEQCQEGAIQLGGLIEQEEGEGFVTVGLLEDYCENIYQFHENIGVNGTGNSVKMYKVLQRQLIQVENSIKNDIRQKIEAVFLPYNVSMWDSLESVWKAADEDENCDAYVIPIPYYDKNPDGSFKEEHWEGDQYPDYVPITRYDAYNFAERRPDMIFIHNPYDDCNYVTSVHPFFYSKNLKQFTDNLVYIPYFILAEISPDNQQAVEGMQHFCTVPGVINADRVVVQSENMRQIYINVLTKNTGKDTRSYWESKILGLGSPKVDKILNIKKEDLQISEEWLNIIQKPDGSWKKVVFYNTSIGALLQHERKILEKMKEVFKTFKESQNDVALLWRPHPLIKATIESMKPQLWEEYRELVERYREERWGIYDDSADMDRTIAVSDAYYGDLSSVVQLFRKTEKPIIIQNVDAVKENSCSLAMDNIIEYQGEWWFLALKDNGLYKMHKNTLEASLITRIPYDGMEQVQEYGKIYIYKDKVFVLPWGAKKIAVYDIQKKELRYLEFGAEEIYQGMKFLKGIIRENRLYLVPCSFSKLLYIDMDQETVHIVADLLSPAYSFSPVVHNLAWGEVFDEGDWIFFTELEENKVIHFNIKTGAQEIYESDLLDSGGAGVCGDSRGIWIIPRRADVILYWDRSERQIYTYRDFPQGYQPGDLSFYKIYLDEGILYLLPRDANMLVSIDREGHMRNVFPQEEHIDNSHSMDRYMRYSNMWRNGDEIFFISAKKGDLYSLKNKENPVKQKISILIPPNFAPDVTAHSLIMEKENSFENIEQLLRAISKKQNLTEAVADNKAGSFGKNTFTLLQKM